MSCHFKRADSLFLSIKSDTRKKIKYFKIEDQFRK